MGRALQIAQTYTNTALNELEKLEVGLQKAIEDFAALKSGEVSLEDLVVSDNGWEFMPPAPEGTANSATPVKMTVKK